MRERLADLPEITILQMICQQQAYEGDSKDREFSATSKRAHWRSGWEERDPVPQRPAESGAEQ